MNKESIERMYENILLEIERIKDNEAIINNNHYFGLDSELLTYIRFLEQEIKEYKLELQKADSITQSCIFNGKKESEISFRKCLNRLEKSEKARKDAIEELYIWGEILNPEFQQKMLDILNIETGSDK